MWERPNTAIARVSFAWLQKGDTPIIDAALWNQAFLVAELVRLGADIHVKGNVCTGRELRQLQLMGLPHSAA